MTEGKQKLTLSVDSETVDRAKSLGINISDLTEQVLRSFTFKPEDAESSAIKKQREEFFRAMGPLASRYGLRVVVGTFMQYKSGEDDWEEAGDIALVGTDQFEHPFLAGGPDGEPLVTTLDDITEDRDFVSFLTTETVLKNFMTAVEDEKTKRKQQVASLAVARKIVEAITEVDDAEVGQQDASRREVKK